MAKSKYAALTTKERRERGAREPYTKEELRAMLPKVGDMRMEKMTCSTSCSATNLTEPQLCMVVEVNEEHLWYRVRFANTNLCQCFKLPEVTYTGPRAGWD